MLQWKIVGGGVTRHRIGSVCQRHREANRKRRNRSQMSPNPILNPPRWLHISPNCSRDKEAFVVMGRKTCPNGTCRDGSVA